ncbi:MATE family efflux transporter [Finegoldia sp. BIOML-A3]|uniref:MATE family efflux transporter n=1 Tax=Finegoldia TaxID=150022 RepID=UPI0012B016DD|nr:MULTISPECIES: MATE family efflux transporter [Finegoldia]MCC2717079.1 MATE family efflux transporter [Finegoldia magna]MDU3804835.1 MATE family efflux transporter [Finegoldia magna]MSA98921.1 MATE family efflux transporter [Finegoldia sp. BIOML-A3]MSB92923.1 MATE family efflux transporter [Finegoldia sp. BIOML-A4]
MGNKKSNIEFITNGNITDVIFKLSIPLMISNLIKTLYGITDGIYVAQISSEDYAATSFTWPVLYLFIAVGLGVSVAATSLMSQRLGARKLKDCSIYAVHTLILTTVLGVIFSILGVITAPFIVRWMGATGSFEYKSYIFLAINSVGLLFDMIFFGYQSILNSQGRTKSMTIISTISSITNVVLDPFFIFDNVLGIPGLNMGLAGAAWATVLSKVLLVVFAIRVVKKESEIEVSFKNFRLDMGIIKHIFSIAIPASLGSSGEAIGFTVLNGFIQSYGTTTLAAFSMGNRLSDIFNQGAIGIGMALTSITGQNMGAGKKERSKDIFKRANVIITFFSLASAIIILLFKDQLLSIFIKDRSDIELWRQASEYMYFSAIITFFMGYFSAINGFFQGVGKTKLTMYLSLARLWVLRLPLIMILKSLTNLGSTGIWISMLVSNALTVIVGFIIYKRGRWER